MGGDTGEPGEELAGIAWEKMGWMGVGVQGAGGAQGGRPGGEAADTGGARVFRRSRNGLRPVGDTAKPCPAWEKG